MLSPYSSGVFAQKKQEASRLPVFRGHVVPYTATQAGFLRQYFPFLKTGEFILPPQHKKGAHLAARPGFNISHLIRVNFRMEVLKAFKEPQPLLPAMSKVKTGISCGQGNTVFSHLPPHRSAARFPADRAGGKTGKRL